MRKLKASLVAGAVFSLALVLGACASPQSTPDESVPQTPGVADGLTDPATGAAWLDEGRLIGIVTYGSSSCVPVAEAATVDDDVITVAFMEEPADRACTADMAPRVTIVGVPAGVDVTDDVTVVVEGTDFRTELDGLDNAPAASTDYAPSAGWLDDKGSFVVLTWGSSTCVPTIESVEPTGDADVAVTFAAVPEDQPCTMDMVPRAALAGVTGLATDDDITVLFSGANITGSAPILGD